MSNDNTELEAWWEYDPAYDAHGLEGDLAYKGLLKRAVWHPGERLFLWNRSGCFEGTWDELVENVWPEGYQVLNVGCRPVPDPAEGQDWPEDPRPPETLVGIHPNGSISIKHRVLQDPPYAAVEVYTSDEDVYWKIRRWSEKNLTPTSEMGVVRCLSRPKPTSPFSLIDLGRFEDTYEPGNYTPEVIEQFDRLIEDLNSPNPRGRMAIIHGRPGTGKTYLLKAITQACPKALVIFVPNTLVADLGNPELIEVFTENRRSVSQRIILLAEDADIIFRKRDRDNTNAISSALNLTDGMFGELLKVYIVGTTNVKLDEVDEAIKRPGRLSEEISVGGLSADQAAAVYRRLKGESAEVPEAFKDGATLAEIYSTAGVHAKKPTKKRRTASSGRVPGSRRGDSRSVRPEFG